MKLLILSASGEAVELTEPAKADVRRRLKSLLDSADDVRESLTVLRTRIDLHPRQKNLRALRQDIDDITHKMDRFLNNAEISQITLLLDSENG